MADRLKTIFGHLNSAEPVPSPTYALQSALQPASEFKYTTGGILTPEQRQFYEDNGYLVIRKLVPKEKLDVYRKQFQKICDGDIYVPGMTVMKDVAIAKTHLNDKGERFITKIQNFENDDVLFEYCRLPEVLQYVKSIIGPNCVATHTMVINKPPDPGTKTSRHPMHQDLYYFPFRPAHKIVCSWTAMQRVYRENGCLVVIPGSHKGELLEHGYPEWEGGVNKAYHGIKGYRPDMERLWVEMDEGDTVFFHPVLLHGSGANRTDNFRKSISCHYAASDCEYINVKGTTQEVIAREVLDIVAKKLGKDVADTVDYRDIWRFRARLVCGNEGPMTTGNYDK